MVLLVQQVHLLHHPQKTGQLLQNKNLQVQLSKGILIRSRQVLPLQVQAEQIQINRQTQDQHNLHKGTANRLQLIASPTVGQELLHQIHRGTPNPNQLEVIIVSLQSITMQTGEQPNRAGQRHTINLRGRAIKVILHPQGRTVLTLLPQSQVAVKAILHHHGQAEEVARVFHHLQGRVVVDQALPHHDLQVEDVDKLIQNNKPFFYHS